MADPKELTDRIAREENEADKKAFDKITVEPIKRGLSAAKDYVFGTDEQNKAAADRMKARDAANPDSVLTKMNKALGYGSAEGKKKGGVIRSSASKRADGCAIKGKTKGRIV